MLDELRREQGMPITLLNQLRRRKDLREQVSIVSIANAANPAKMVQAKIIEFKLERICAECCCDRFKSLQWGVADANYVQCGVI